MNATFFMVTSQDDSLGHLEFIDVSLYLMTRPTELEERQRVHWVGLCVGRITANRCLFVSLITLSTERGVHLGDSEVSKFDLVVLGQEDVLRLGFGLQGLGFMVEG